MVDPAIPGPQEAVDHARLEQVRDEVGATALRRYADTYLGLLAARMDWLEGAIRAGDTEEAARVLLDLRVNSAMLGATRFTELVSDIETALAQGAYVGGIHLAGLRAEAARVAGALRRALDAWRPET